MGLRACGLKGLRACVFERLVGLRVCGFEGLRSYETIPEILV